ncbi:MAG TPA: aminoglycoside phosphotransferase family protein [Caulobacteraceae bacterium]|jgi:streptomycin 6-kinase
MTVPAADDGLAPWLRRWALTPDGPAFETKFGSRLAPVLTASGERAMLKVAAHPEEVAGGALMAWWDGLGAAAVLAREGYAILLERLEGPRSLAALARQGADDEATRILCKAAAGLHAPRSAPPPPTLVPLDIWFRALWPAETTHGGAFATAAAVARELLDDPRDPVVLHGDLHHENVLDGGARGWLAIDPKGLVGERAFEFANLFRNPDAGLALAPGRMGRQAGIVAETACLERSRLLRWVLAYAGLGAAWSLQSGHEADASAGLDIARAAEAELGS